MIDPDGGNLVKYVDGNSSGGASSLVNSVVPGRHEGRLQPGRGRRQRRPVCHSIDASERRRPGAHHQRPGPRRAAILGAGRELLPRCHDGRQRHGLVTSAPAGINCRASCSAQFDDPQTVTLTASPDAGQLFAGWSGACAGIETCTVPMLGDRDVTATFAAPAPHGGGGGGFSSFFITVDVSKTTAKPGDLVDVDATIKNTSATGAQAVHAFLATPAGTVLTGPPSVTIGSGCAGASQLSRQSGAELQPGLPRRWGDHPRPVRTEDDDRRRLQPHRRRDRAEPEPLEHDGLHRQGHRAGGGGLQGRRHLRRLRTHRPSRRRRRKGSRRPAPRAPTRCSAPRATTPCAVSGGNDVLRGLRRQRHSCSAAPGTTGSFGGAGNDQLLGGTGKDVIYGGPGNDTISARDGRATPSSAAPDATPSTPTSSTPSVATARSSAGSRSRRRSAGCSRGSP